MNELDKAVQLFEEQRFDEAILIYGKLIASEPDDAWLHHAIGLCFTQLNRHEEALASLDMAIRLSPNEGIFFYHFAIVFERTGDVELAIKAYERALELDDSLAVIWNSLAQLYVKDKKVDNAINAYENLLKHHPENHHAKHMLLSLSGSNVTKATKEYIEDYFDSASSYFDEHLKNNLNYKLPKDISSLTSSYLNKRSKVLDLGCGTGLVGKELSDLTCEIDGVDLSSKMLEIANEKNIYSKLYEQDIYEFLLSVEDRVYDMVSAADLFIYIGSLETTFIEVSRILKDGGIFVFSTQDGDKDFSLLKTGRFAQSENYITKIAKSSGFTEIIKNRVVIREEIGEYETGFLWLFSKKPRNLV